MTHNSGNWDSGELKLYSNIHMTDYIGTRAILASAAIPGFFPPTEVGAQPFVDGGVVLNTPLLPAVDAGADILHAIYMDPDVSNIPSDDLGSALQTMYRMQVIGWARLINREVDHDKTLNGAVRILAQLEPAAAQAIEDFFLTRDPDSKFARRLLRPAEKSPSIAIIRPKISAGFSGSSMSHVTGLSVSSKTGSMMRSYTTVKRAVVCCAARMSKL
jgi:predicted acylesterase/phospholipase RssA